MWWILLWFSVVFGLGLTENQFSGHDPNDLVHFGWRCAESYVKDSFDRTSCILLLDRLNKDNKDFNDSIKAAESFKSKIMSILTEQEAFRSMRAALLSLEANGTQKLRSACQKSAPDSLMRRTVEVFDVYLWKAIKSKSTSETLLKLVFKRLDELAGVDSICLRIATNDSSLIRKTHNYLWSLKENVLHTYRKANGDMVPVWISFQPTYIKKRKLEGDSDRRVHDQNQSVQRTQKQKEAPPPAPKKVSNGRSDGGVNPAVYQGAPVPPKQTDVAKESGKGKGSGNGKGTGQESEGDNGSDNGKDTGKQNGKDNGKDEGKGNKDENKEEKPKEIKKEEREKTPQEKEAERIKQGFKDFGNRLSNSLANANIKEGAEILKPAIAAGMMWLKNGTSTRDGQKAIARAILGATAFIGRVLPIPYNAIANVLTGVIGLTIDASDEVQKTPLDLVHDSMKEMIGDIKKDMERHYEALTKEIQEISLMEFVLIPGKIIDQAIQAYTFNDDRNNLLNVCNSLTKNQLFAAMEAYVLDEKRGYFAKTLIAHGTIPMFEEVYNLTSYYMLCAIHAQELCSGLNMFQEFMDQEHIGARKMKSLDPHLDFMIERYNLLMTKMSGMREQVELNSMRKAANFVEDELKHLVIVEDKALMKRKTREIAKKVNDLWSIQYDYSIIWGDIQHFLIPEVNHQFEKKETPYEDLIINTMKPEKCFAVIRKHKNRNLESRKISHEDLHNRWLFYKEQKNKNKDYYIDMAISFGKLMYLPSYTLTKALIKIIKEKGKIFKKSLNPPGITEGRKAEYYYIKKEFFDPFEDAYEETRRRAEEAAGTIANGADKAGEAVVDAYEGAEKEVANAGKIIGEGVDNLRQMAVDSNITFYITRVAEVFDLKLGMKGERQMRTVPDYVSPQFNDMTYERFERDGWEIMLYDPKNDNYTDIVYAWGEHVYASDPLGSFVVIENEQGGKPFASIQF